jgi:enolase
VRELASILNEGETSLADLRKISQIKGRQVLDSRGNPTVEVDVHLESGTMGRATVPSGASTGSHEALELRDGNQRIYQGKSVLKAVSNINEILGPKLVGLDARNQSEIDRLMIEIDGTKNKQRIGANTILGISMAVARSAANEEEKSLYRYLADLTKYKLPVPMMNVINGGKHAGNELSVQEFLIEPAGAPTFSDSLRIGADVYHSLKGVLVKKYGSSASNVGDEGGYAPAISKTRDALEAILNAVGEAGYGEHEIKLGIDAAASSFYDGRDDDYRIDGKRLKSSEMHDFYLDLVSSFPIKTIEDPFCEDDFENFAAITRKIGDKVKIIGDDLYVTNPERIKQGIEKKATNAILIKLNQIGTLTETIEAIKMSRAAGFSIIISHRSGETEDNFISHLATAFESEFIKTGAPARGERTAKYNELLRIEEELGRAGSSFQGDAAFE